MSVSAVFPGVRQRAGMYESFYLRAVSPQEPLGVWIRYTVHKRPGEDARGSLWCTIFDAARGRPFQQKLSSDELSVPSEGWIAIAGAELGPRGARGAMPIVHPGPGPGNAEGMPDGGEVRWSLRFTDAEPELRHLPRPWMYGAPLPRTKLTSPAPAVSFEGTVELPDRRIELRNWHGMLGHNWGAEHAERWIWLHGIDFSEDPRAWLDVAIGRVRVGGLSSPWVANGALSLEGRRLPIGGLGARGLLVVETPARCRLSLPGAEGLRIDAHIDTPARALAGWSYSDPDGGLHDVSNCSIASLNMTVRRPGMPARTLHTAHGAVYELGMREHDHGVSIAPFAD